MTWQDIRTAVDLAEAQYGQEIAALTAQVADLQAQLDAAVAQPPPPPPSGKTLFGWCGPDPTGHAQISRVFLNVGDKMPSLPGVMAITYKGPLAGGKPDKSKPIDHAGRVAEAKKLGRLVYLGPQHEPEGPGGADFTPAEYRAEWQKLHDEIAKQNATNVRTLWVMMAASFKSGTAAKYYPGVGLVDVVGADGYDFCGCTDVGNGYAAPGGSHRNASAIFGDALAFAKAHGKKAMACEWGTPARKDGDESDRLAVIENGIKYFGSDPAWIGVTYFQKTPPAFKCWYALKGASYDAYVKAVVGA